MGKRIRGTVTENRDKATLEFLPDSGASGQLEFDEADLLGLIQMLGRLHSSMREGKQQPAFDGTVTIQAVISPSWFVQPEMMNEAAGLTFYHPGFGPVGFLIPIDQVQLMIQLLTTQVELSQESKRSPKN